MGNLWLWFYLTSPVWIGAIIGGIAWYITGSWVHALIWGVPAAIIVGGFWWLVFRNMWI